MPQFKPIRQLRVSEEVVRELKQSILSGQIQPGDKLPSERELADQFEVSRLGIREALRSLQDSGFVAIRKGSGGGIFVTDLTFEQLAKTYLDLFLNNKISIPEMFALRQLVEPEVARAATQRISPQYSYRLRKALEAEKLPIAGLLEDVEAKTAFHFILAEMCGNRFYEGLVRSTMGLTKKIMEAVRPVPQVMHPKGMHDPVYDAVLRGDPEGAFSAMRQHMIEFGENMVKMEETFRQKSLNCEADV